MELLSPAGSFESLMAAFQAGADAVYMGGPLFGARAFADNPAGEQLLKALDYAHLRDKKVYLTVNTLLKEQEMENLLFDYMDPLVCRGLDGVIVQDMGVLAFLREHFPSLPLHASTQMAVSGPEGARLLKQRGVKRLVLPRELSLKEIEAMGRESGLETEVFVHGALCYCWSGRCLMSSFLGGRSGNRGRCAQPCRLPYEGGRLMNMRDLCGLDELPALQAAGVCSLKIEGRMKSPEYTAGVTAIYRKYLDQMEVGAFRVRQDDRQALSALFDRGGFTEGYYRRHNGADMLDPGPKKTHVSLEETGKEIIREAYLGEHPLPIDGFYELFQHQPARLRLGYRGTQVQAEGALVEAAQNQPLSAEKLRQQLMKTGGSGFVFHTLEGYLEEGCFLPLGAVNELRRRGLESLEEALLKPFRRPAAKKPARASLKALNPKAEAAYPALPLLVQLDDIRLLELVLAHPVQGVYLPADYVSPEDFPALAEKVRRTGKRIYYALPPVLRRPMGAVLGSPGALEALHRSKADGVLLASPEEAAFWQEKELPGERIFDHSLYTWNRWAAREAAAWGAQCLTLPLEPHEKDLAALGESGLPREQLIYGRTPLMISAQCLFKTEGHCLKEAGNPALTRPQTTPLVDRTGAAHFCQARCRHCFSILYNAVPLYLADMPLYGERLRIHFTTETKEEAESLLGHILSGLQAGSRKALAPPPGLSFTRGNYKKGVE